jgi:hypothetical protein
MVVEGAVVTLFGLSSGSYTYLHAVEILSGIVQNDCRGSRSASSACPRPPRGSGGPQASGATSMSRDIMARAEDYERYAEHCLKMAEIADSREDRIIRRDMAVEWLTLAAALRKTKAYPRNLSPAYRAALCRCARSCREARLPARAKASGRYAREAHQPRARYRVRGLG